MKILDIKIPDTNFLVAELVPIELFDPTNPGLYSRYCSLMLAHHAQGIRDHFGGRSMTINNKCYGGVFNYRGYRQPSCTEGAPLSAHRRNLAFDFNIAGIPDLVVRQEIVNSYRDLGITVIEDGMDGWVHVGFEWFIGHEKDLGVFDMKTNTLIFLNDWAASKYKVRAA